MGRRLSESLEQGLVMARPRARMTNDQSTGIVAMVFVWNKFNYDWHGWKTVKNKPHQAAHNASCVVTWR